MKPWVHSPSKAWIVTWTGLLEDGVGRSLPEHRLRDYVDHVPLKRVGTLAEVARFAAFLVSDANAYMTGETIVMDGGL